MLKTHCTVCISTKTVAKMTKNCQKSSLKVPELELKVAKKLKLD